MKKELITAQLSHFAKSLRHDASIVTNPAIVACMQQIVQHVAYAVLLPIKRHV
jgi:hypothetical protein